MNSTETPADHDVSRQCESSPQQLQSPAAAARSRSDPLAVNSPPSALMLESRRDGASSSVDGGGRGGIAGGPAEAIGATPPTGAFRVPEPSFGSSTSPGDGSDGQSSGGISSRTKRKKYFTYLAQCSHCTRKEKDSRKRIKLCPGSANCQRWVCRSEMTLFYAGLPLKCCVHNKAIKTTECPCCRCRK